MNESSLEKGRYKSLFLRMRFYPNAPHLSRFLSLLLASCNLQATVEWTPALLSPNTDGWESCWLKSDSKRSEGKVGSFKHIAGKWSADPDDKAHASKVEERNAQCRHISHSFMSKKSPYAGPSHITVCLGDLNYWMQGIDTLPTRSLIQ